ncbi:MAG: pyridoxal-phosphate dependent enzyme, partial [Acidobacteriota bacterium]|nr:pyridoxal-phosphate dependent enzyme [Acidobacteriota bacterium]
LITGIETILQLAPGSLSDGPSLEVEDGFCGDGYGIPTELSREALDLLARRDAILLDPTYTAKAMAALIAYIRENRFRDDQTVLFWHTGGQVNLFA